MTTDEALVAELRRLADAVVPGYESGTFHAAADAIARLSADRQDIRAEAFREAAGVARERASGWTAGAEDNVKAGRMTVAAKGYSRADEGISIATAIEALAAPPSPPQTETAI